VSAYESETTGTTGLRLLTEQHCVIKQFCVCATEQPYHYYIHLFSDAFF